MKKNYWPYMAAALLPVVGCQHGVRVKHPNIILVMTDDQGFGDLSCYGSPDVYTPNLDRLYAQSIRFTDFHVSPTCAPTRSALMTGRAPFMNGVTHTIWERERLSLRATTIAQVLRSNGYATGIFGKWHLGDEDAYQPDMRGFDRMFIHGGGGIGQAYACSCADVPDNSYFDPVIKDQSVFVKTEGFCTDVFFTAALQWIKSNADKKQPFFAYLATNAPHSPYHAPESYRQKFIEEGYGRNAQGFYGMVENIDSNMGRLMKALKEWHLEKNTILIFMTDNGKALSADRRPDGSRVQQYNAGMKGYKNTVHEGGTHVPFFIRWTGHWQGGRDISRLANHFDLFLTFAELTGTEIPDSITFDGRSLLPLIEDQNADWPDRFRVFQKGRWPVGAEPDSFKYINFAVRNERFRMVGMDELYDIKADPGETNNVIQQHPDVVREMLQYYDRWWSEARPLMVNEGVPMSKVRPFHERYKRQMKEGGLSFWDPGPDLGIN